MLHVLVCDDDANRAKDWRDEIEFVLKQNRDDTRAAQEGDRDSGAAGREEVSVECLRPTELAEALSGLAHRQRDARAGSSPITNAALSRVEASDILVIDHDLTPTIDDPDTDALQGRSGEGFAMLARCFSTAGLIVLVNKGVQMSTFDLTMTRFADSYADLNVTDQDLDRSALWCGVREYERPFRPSHWPLLERGGRHLESLMDSIHLDQPVLTALGLADVLPDFDRGQLDALGDEPGSTTFRDLATRPGLGLGLKDKQSDEALLTRIAVFGVYRWLNGTVLAGQNVLVDLPHLLERAPRLRGSIDLDALEPRDLLDRVSAIKLIPELSMLDSALVPACGWLGRPTWLCSRLDASVLEGDEPGWADAPVVMCEDVSAFVDIGDAREFEAAVAGPYVQRFVRYLQKSAESIAYLPRNRLLR